MLLTTLVACSLSTLQVDLSGDDTTGPDTGESVLDSGLGSGDTATEEETCEQYPVVDLYGGSPAEGEVWNPRWVAPGFVGSVDRGSIHDFDWNGTATSSYFYFIVADAEAEDSCIVYYDLSLAEPASIPWMTDQGGLLFEAWDLVLRDGFSDCSPIAADEWGVADLRDLFEQHTWGWAFGESVRVAEYMSANVEDWETFWRDHLVSGYVQSSAYSDEIAYELAWAAGVEADCGVAVLDNDGEPTFLPAAQEGPLPSSIWQAASVYTLDLDYLK